MATPATGLLKSLPDTLDGVATDIDAKLAVLEEQRTHLLRDRAVIAELRAVARMAELSPDTIRLMDAPLEDAA
jgi:hypothetical protein